MAHAVNYHEIGGSHEVAKVQAADTISVVCTEFVICMYRVTIFIARWLVNPLPRITTGVTDQRGCQDVR